MLLLDSYLPEITLDTLSGRQNNLSKSNGGFKLIVVYRGYHCPVCKEYLNNLNELYDDFKKLHTEIVAISGDTEKQAEYFDEGLNAYFDIGYGLSELDMKALNLYISEPISYGETDHNFPEPGLFLLNSEGKLQIVDISNSPFSRPDLSKILDGINFIKENNYPIRGTVK